eukprot:CAMPEP_0114692758 /NCGR_PEP_ID=MMETSP0191-20121206/68303_1 /TAXON_ID=126664 /ORGANISM="Sorites sp." /LENGTH=33 /DNA_ID= /DNA_START= /DNA_END= /DNA_ORIENTATION=
MAAESLSTSPGGWANPSAIGTIGSAKKETDHRN